MTTKNKNEGTEKGPLSFFMELLMGAGLTRKDIYMMFREYENERIFVPDCPTRWYRFKTYSARVWACKKLYKIVLEAFDNGEDIIEAILLFEHQMDEYACESERPEQSIIFSTCHDIADDILGMFLV